MLNADLFVAFLLATTALILLPGLQALIGAVGSVVLGGLGTLAVAVLWRRWFPALAARDALDAGRR